MERYRIHKYLNEERRIAGLTVFDEFIPIFSLIFFGFLLRVLPFGFALGVVWFFAVRRCKAKWGNFKVAGYWFFSEEIGKLFLPKFPESSQRFWRA